MSKFNKDNHESDVKEEFCGACLAIPAALVGLGAAGAGSKKGGHSKMKKMLLWGGITVTLVSAIVAVIYLMKCKNCR
jgi:hypothetical protein